jgi:hypothetical protein
MKAGRCNMTLAVECDVKSESMNWHNTINPMGISHNFWMALKVVQTMNFQFSFVKIHFSVTIHSLILHRVVEHSHWMQNVSTWVPISKVKFTQMVKGQNLWTVVSPVYNFTRARVSWYLHMWCVQSVLSWYLHMYVCRLCCSETIDPPALSVLWFHLR